MDKEFEYKEEYQYLTNIMLNVTDDCNLACRYCFVEQHPHYMSLDTAKDTADWAYNNLLKKQKFYPNLKQCELNFFGGEPTLCYDSIIVPLVLYCEEKYPNIFKFGMTTNGTLLNEKRIDFLKEHNFGLLLSIDGAAETQNYNRPCRDGQESFKLLEKNIPYLLKNFPNITFRSTGYAPTIHHLFENYLYAESLGFKAYVMIPDIRHQWNKEEVESFQEQLNQIYFYRLQQISNGVQPMKVSRINDYLKYTIELNDNNSKFFNKEQYLNVYRCGLGITLGAIGWDGNIYGCQEQVSKDSKNIFNIGNIYNNGIDTDKHFKLLKIYIDNLKTKTFQKEECQQCKMSPLCSINRPVCPSSSYDLYNNMSTIMDAHCEMIKCYYENSLMLLLIASELNNEYFNNYLEKCLNYS